MPRYSRYGRGSRYGLRSYRGRYSGTFKSGRYGSSLRGTSRVSAIARAVAGLQAHARRVGNPERKWVDSQFTDTYDPTTPASVNVITDIASNFNTGAGASNVGQVGQMVGNKVTIDSIQLQGAFNVFATGGPPPVISDGGSALRVVLYEDTDPDGTVATPAQIFFLDTTLPSPTVTTYSLRNMSYSTRFRVLMDHKFTLSSQGTMSHVFNKYFKIGRQIQFNVNGSGQVITGTVGTNRTFGVLCILDQTSANSVYGTVNARVRYTDN